MANANEKKIILTGDRPTGKLHIGHYVGSLRNRVALQNSGDYETFIMIADMQALTDNARDPEKIRKSLTEVTLDYLAVGIDPKKSTILVQSQIPALNELTMIYLNLVSLARLERNPTVKSEISQKGFGQSIPAGFLTYPVSQQRYRSVMIKSQCWNRHGSLFVHLTVLTTKIFWLNQKAYSHQRGKAGFLA